MGTMLKKLNKGFTLLELLLSIALISVLAGFSLPVYRTLIKKNDLDIAANSIVASLRRAQILSQAVDGDITWGVKVQSGSIVVFKGASYATRDTAYDEIFDVPTSIGIGGTGEYVFAKMTGLPQSTGTTTLTSESDTRTVSINAKGMVGY